MIWEADMIRYDTSNDKTAKAIICWCRQKRYQYSFETRDRQRICFVYPFDIDAPEEFKKDLEEYIGRSVSK